MNVKFFRIEAKTKFLILILLCCGALSNSKTTTVTTVKDLQKTINEAIKGDIIMITNGIYSNNNITITTNGITVQAEALGKVFLTGENKILIIGNNITFSGFQFINGSLPAGDAVIEIRGNNNTITQCNWSGYSAEKYIILKEKTQYNTISFCNMENKPASAPIGCLIQILPSEGIPNYHKITHCTFQNLKGDGGDYGNEPIRIGLGLLSNFESRTVIEYCYWNNTGLGDSESISVKSMENVIRYNVFDRNVGGMLVFRNGNRNIAYGNMFIRQSGGIRLKEANDILIFNNYFDGSVSNVINNAIAFDYIDPNLKNINILHNTFVESSIDVGELLVSPKQQTSINFVNNIFYKKKANVFFTSSKSKEDKLLLSNILNFNGNIFDSMETLITNDDNAFKNEKNAIKEVKLEKKIDGFYGLSSSSPAINSSYGNYSNLLEFVGIDGYFKLSQDINQNSRPSENTKKDVGCEEYNDNMSSVGYKYLNIKRGPDYFDFEKIVADVDKGFNIRTSQAYLSLTSLYVKMMISLIFIFI